MAAIPKSLRWVLGVIATMAILFWAPVAFLDRLDRCDQQSGGESQRISKKVRALLAKKGAFSVQEVINNPPLFYCLAAHRADFAGLATFAQNKNYTLPAHKYNCGFWSYEGRLLLFFQESVLEAQVPLNLLPDESAVMCFEDLTKIHKR